MVHQVKRRKSGTPGVLDKNRKVSTPLKPGNNGPSQATGTNTPNSPSDRGGGGGNSSNASAGHKPKKKHIKIGNRAQVQLKFYFWTSVIAASAFKFLFIHSYKSTDFEVHRNWMAITHTLPLEKWYYDETSEWTLDYPPFFAYFEWGLSQIAKFVDPGMVKLTNTSYISTGTVTFQRMSVVASDFLLAYGIKECANVANLVVPVFRYPFTAEFILFGLIFANGGLFIVDHIHFQYNGLLFGILLLSIARIFQDKPYQAASLFSFLLNMKHIFLYIAPAFGIYLLRKHCFRPGRFVLTTSITSLIKLGFVVITVFLASFGPFYQHIPQIIKRLFPFKRGLSHAYWAPNFWAGYNSLDLLLNFALKKGKSGVTGGLVGEYPLAVLPQVQPIHTFGITVLFMMPALIKIWTKPTDSNFLRGLITMAWTSFLFGYHVHEKAILNVIIPFSLIAISEPRLFLLTLVSGTVSLFPLLFTQFEVICKALIALFHITLTLSVIPTPDLYILDSLYLYMFVPLYFLENFGHVLVPKYPFLPLVCMSLYCFIGIFYSYIAFYWKFMFEPEPFKGSSSRKLSEAHNQTLTVRGGATKGARKKKFF